MSNLYDQAILTLTYSDVIYLFFSMVCFGIAIYKWRKYKLFDWLSLLIGLIFLSPVMFFFVLDNYVMRR